MYDIIKLIRKLVVLVIGLTVVVVGVIMILTPGPAIVVIPAGVAILAVEFAWARRLLAKTKEYVNHHMQKYHNGKQQNGQSAGESEQKEQR